jgi:hypothetical protein
MYGMYSKPRHPLFPHLSIYLGGFPQQELNLKFARIKEEKEREREM